MGQTEVTPNTMMYRPGGPPKALFGDPTKLRQQLSGRVDDAALDALGEALKFRPWGHRLVVLREKAPDLYGGVIVVPSAAQRVPASGFIISMGPLVGTEGTQFPGGPPPELAREALLGQWVVFGIYAGSNLKVGPWDKELGSAYTLLLDKEVWGDTMEDQT